MFLNSINICSGTEVQTIVGGSNGDSFLYSTFKSERSPIHTCFTRAQRIFLARYFIYGMQRGQLPKRGMERKKKEPNRLESHAWPEIEDKGK